MGHTAGEAPCQIQQSKIAVNLTHLWQHLYQHCLRGVSRQKDFLSHRFPVHYYENLQAPERKIGLNQICWEYRVGTGMVL